MKGTAEVIKVLNEVLRKETHRHQSVLYSLQDVQKLGVRGVGGGCVEEIH
jgi:hypothetical protein